jgi:hypothetical protein
MRFD